MQWSKEICAIVVSASRAEDVARMKLIRGAQNSLWTHFKELSCLLRQILQRYRRGGSSEAAETSWSESSVAWSASWRESTSPPSPGSAVPRARHRRMTAITAQSQMEKLTMPHGEECAGHSDQGHDTRPPPAVVGVQNSERLRGHRPLR